MRPAAGFWQAGCFQAARATENRCSRALLREGEFMRSGRRFFKGAVLAWVAALFLACLPAPAPARGSLAEPVAPAALPREARDTYALIQAGGPFPYARDGATFGNYEGALPPQRRGYYREYTVPTPGVKNRGARRIVCGGAAADWRGRRPAACYYTGDHYASFRQIGN
jgi:ribonuclease T1